MSGADRLGRYRDRRDFRESPEPPGEGAPAGSDGDDPIFVIQEHDASSHHYDLRLEVDGVLASWAVPQGPSTDPSEKRLAIRTEDHPIDYADFEGTIPEDEYGGGTVLVWDAGPYRNIRRDDKDREVTVADALEDGGPVEVWLLGRKLRGGYALVPAKVGGDEKNWLLVKMDDGESDARRNPVSTEPESVLSGRTIDEVAAAEEEDTGSRKEDR